MYRVKEKTKFILKFESIHLQINYTVEISSYAPGIESIVLINFFVDALKVFNATYLKLRINMSRCSFQKRKLCNIFLFSFFHQKTIKLSGFVVLFPEFFNSLAFPISFSSKSRKVKVFILFLQHLIQILSKLLAVSLFNLPSTFLHVCVQMMIFN